MDLLQIGLIFLIMLLSIFLAITGFQVFLILRDLKKALNRLNRILQSGEEIVQEVEEPVAQAANLVAALQEKAKQAIEPDKKEKHSAPRPKRFYRKTL